MIRIIGWLSVGHHHQQGHHEYHHHVCFQLVTGGSSVVGRLQMTKLQFEWKNIYTIL